MLIATDMLDVPAWIIALLYQYRWTIEIFFRFFKHILGCRHLLSHDPVGIKIQTYCAIIVCMLISLWTGRKPTLRTYEMICYYFIGLADEEELQKVLLNLFLNGIEASQGEGGVLAEVGFAGAPYIRVTDRGCGMSPRFVRRDLFTPFRTTKQQGLGIGLYQCRQIVAAHGGRIEVASVEGDGTVFTVWLQAGAAQSSVGWVTQAA